MMPDKPLSPILNPKCCPFCGTRDIFRSVWYLGMWACRDCSAIFQPLAALSPAALGAETVAASGEYVSALLDGTARNDC